MPVDNDLDFSAVSVSARGGQARASRHAAD